MIAASLARPPRFKWSTGLALEKARSPPPRCAARNERESISSSSDSATRGSGLAAPVREQQQDLVVSCDLDVLHVGQIDERLETPEPEEAVEDRCRERLLIVDTHEPAAVEGLRPGVVLQETPDDRPAELAAVLLVHTGSGAQLLGEFL
jgi:hypothetical protein